MPQIDSIQSQAEQQAIQQVEAVRQQLVVRIVGANSLEGFASAGIKSDANSVIRSSMDYVANQFNPYYQQAWSAGIARGGALDATGQTSLVPQIERFQEITRNGFRSLQTQMEGDVSTLLSRAALGTLSKEEVLKKIGTNIGTGLFKAYQARAVGIVEYETFQIEGFASRLRAIEVANKAKQVQAFEDAISRVKSGRALKTAMVFLTRWNHHESGNPRPGHEDMDGLCVTTGTDFALTTRDGDVVMCEGPYAANLDIGETANCYCDTTPIAFRCTPAQKAEIESRSDETGGVDIDEVRDILSSSGDAVAEIASIDFVAEGGPGSGRRPGGGKKAYVPHPREAKSSGLSINSSQREIEAKLSKSPKVRARLAKPEKTKLDNAIYGYTGIDHLNINSSLRAGRMPKDVELKNTIQILDEHMDIMPKGIHELYRGVPRLPCAQKIGASFQDNGFVSTSTSIESAKGFLSLYKGCIMKITNPQDARGMDLRRTAKTGEREILLERGKTFRVTGVQRNAGTTIAGTPYNIVSLTVS